MADMFFLTSNRSKLSHLKHIARRFGIDLAGFRERTYMGPYNEPRIHDREKLLTASFNSAVNQWRKAFGEADSRVFFLEDTSVRIDALSQSRETPGVDVKYWMRDMTFAKLDRLLRAHGNVRTATVRSDIVAYIPRRLRSILGDGRDFIWVSGETRGHVIETEIDLSTNFVYPWLDGRSFNKWFVPVGYSRPISALDIADADRCDFRHAAFSKLVSSFRGYLTPTKQAIVKADTAQLLLPGLRPAAPIFVFCGYSCAGKSTLATWLAERFGFLHLEASDYMRQAYWERHGLRSEIKIGEFALAALLVEPWIAAAPIARDIERLSYPAVVVTGFRSPSEIAELQNALGERRCVKTVFIEASEATRFGRAKKRKRDEVTADSFALRDRQESSMGLKAMGELGGIVRMENEFRTIPPYARAFMKLCSQEVGELYETVIRGSDPTVGGLERPILLSLLNSPSNQALTTSQIAAAIEYFFDVKKSKNNVSRYFNQEFHPFYTPVLSERKNLYQLSSSGESIAKLLEVGSGLRMLGNGLSL